MYRHFYGHGSSSLLGEPSPADCCGPRHSAFIILAYGCIAIFMDTFTMAMAPLQRIVPVAELPWWRRIRMENRRKATPAKSSNTKRTFCGTPSSSASKMFRLGASNATLGSSRRVGTPAYCTVAMAPLQRIVPVAELPRWRRIPMELALWFLMSEFTRRFPLHEHRSSSLIGQASPAGYYGRRHSAFLILVCGPIAIFYVHGTRCGVLDASLNVAFHFMNFVCTAVVGNIPLLWMRRANDIFPAACYYGFSSAVHDAIPTRMDGVSAQAGLVGPLGRSVTCTAATHSSPQQTLLQRPSFLGLAARPNCLRPPTAVDSDTAPS
ncbi:uncharacterized protein [Dermacentor albipictus]|uniref:uncharacterized protein n=1 Tax=Dermacentor albipictus TaxID=60249 RepID=UPI0038FC0B5E